MKQEKVYNQEVNGDEGFVEGEGNPSCDGSSCANMADGEAKEGDLTDTLTDEPLAEEPKAEVDDFRDKFLRLQAEFDNYRKRTLKEKMDLVQNGGIETLKAFLPIVDDMDRARTAMASSEDIEALRQGVEMIAQKFGEVLKQRGVVEIEAMGLELDTDHHEAIARFKADKEQSGRIIDVVQKGYMLGDKVLRFAKVVVGE